MALACSILLLSTAVQPPAQPVVLTLKGVMASKADFFDDKEVQRLLRGHNIQVEVTRRGSREVALEVTGQQSEQYDFAFPSGQPAADLIKNDRQAKGKYNRTTRLFTSPIVLASYREYAETLSRNGAVTTHHRPPETSLYYTLHTGKFIELGENGSTWNSIGIQEQRDVNDRVIANGNRVLAHSSGVCRSNSAATYLSLLAFVRNGTRPPKDDAEVSNVAQQIQPLITAAGMPESDLFKSYVTPEGKSQGPIVVVYEHQYFAYQIEHVRRHERVDDTRVLLYPEQEFQSDPEFVALTPNGHRLAEVLATDTALQERMKELGYRVTEGADVRGTRQLFDYLRVNGIIPPADRTDLTSADFPELGLLENLIRTVGRCQQ